MLLDEGDGVDHGGVGHEPEGGDDRAAEVHPEHLVVRLHLVPREELVLKRRGETVKAEVAAHERDAVHAGLLLALLAAAAVGRGGGAVEGEDGASRHHPGRDEVVVQPVPLVADEVPPDHDRDHLGALAERLDGERDVLERLVLARGGDHVGARHGRVLVNGRHRCDRAADQREHEHRHAHGHQAVVHDQKHGEGEELLVLALAVRARHDPFLQDTVHQEGAHDADHAPDDLEHGGRRSDGILGAHG